MGFPHPPCLTFFFERGWWNPWSMLMVSGTARSGLAAGEWCGFEVELASVQKNASACAEGTLSLPPTMARSPTMMTNSVHDTP